MRLTLTMRRSTDFTAVWISVTWVEMPGKGSRVLTTIDILSAVSITTSVTVATPLFKSLMSVLTLLTSAWMS